MVVMYSFFEQLSRKLPKIALLICSVSGVALLAVKMWLLVSYHPDISGSETSTIFPVQLLMDGRPVYSDPEQPPFALSQYTPVYFLITASLLKLTPWGPDDLHRIFFASRAVSLAVVLAAVALFGILVYRYTGRKLIAALAGLLVFHILGFWHLTNSRPDSLLVLMTVVFLGAMFRAVTASDGGNIWWYVAAAAAVGSFFVKQSGMIQVIVIGAFCVVEARWRLLARLVILSALVFLTMLWILPVNNYQVFFANIIGGVANSISFAWFFDWTLDKLLRTFSPFIALAFALSLHWIVKSGRPLHRFVAVALPLFFFFDLAISLKIGAGVGYFQDFIIVNIFAAALFIADREELLKMKSGVLRNSLLLYLVFVCVHCSMYVGFRYFHEPMNRYKAQYIEERELSRYLYGEKALAGGEWVHLDIGGGDFRGYFLMHFLFRNVIMPFRDIVELGHANGTFDYGEIGRMIAQRKIAYVISDKGAPPDKILSYDVGSSFRYCCTKGNFDIYTSKK